MPHLPRYSTHGYIVPYMGTIRPLFRWPGDARDDLDWSLIRPRDGLRDSALHPVRNLCGCVYLTLHGLTHQRHGDYLCVCGGFV